MKTRTTRLTVKFPIASPKHKSYLKQREASHIKKNTDAKKTPNAGMRCDYEPKEKYDSEKTTGLNQKTNTEQMALFLQTSAKL